MVRTYLKVAHLGSIGEARASGHQMASDTSCVSPLSGKPGEPFQRDSLPKLCPEQTNRIKALVAHHMEKLQSALILEYEAVTSSLLLEHQNLRPNVVEEDMPRADGQSEHELLYECEGATVIEPSRSNWESQDKQASDVVDVGGTLTGSTLKDTTSMMYLSTTRPRDDIVIPGVTVPEGQTITSNIVKPLVVNHKLDLVCAVVVVANAGTIGYATSRSMAQLDGSEPVHLRILEMAFIVFFVIEIFIRCHTLHWGYFVGTDWQWNWFDIWLVCVSLFQIPQYIAPSTSLGIPLGNISFMRILRVLKILKVLRIVRLFKLFRELRLILSSILGGMRTMIWGILLVMIIKYIVAICFLQGCTQLLQQDPDVSLFVRDAIDEHWCTIMRSMHSLFAACTGGIDWVEVAHPLHAAGWAYYFLFVVYIGFFMFIIANTLTSIFFQATVEHSDTDTELMIQREMECVDNYIQLLQVFFDEIDSDGSGEITFEEFREHLGNPKLRAFSRAMDIPIEDAEQFFRILSNNGANKVDPDTFVVGCIKTKGSAKSIDLFAMHQLLKKVLGRIGELKVEICRVAAECDHLKSTRTRAESIVKKVGKVASQSSQVTYRLEHYAGTSLVPPTLSL